MKLWMPGSDAVEDSEFFDLIERQIEPGEIQPGIEEHAAMSCRENEAVAVDPAGTGGIDLKGMTEKNCTDIGSSERKSQMT